MPVAFDNAASTQTTGAVATITLTVTTGAALVFFASTFTGTDGTATSVLANAVSFTRLSQEGFDSECWMLTAAPSGTVTITAHFSTLSGRWAMAAASYTGVVDSGANGTVAQQTATAANNLNLSVSTTSTDLVVYHFRVNNANALTCTNAGANTRAVQTAAGVVGIIIGDIAGVNGTLSLSATATTTANWHSFGLPLHFSVTSVTASPYRFLALTGAGT